MATRVTVSTAQEYAKALAPHLAHESYRCDRPYDRIMGKGCRTCGVETVIALADFISSGDLPVFEKELEPFLPKKGKKG